MSMQEILTFEETQKKAQGTVDVDSRGNKKTKRKG